MTYITQKGGPRYLRGIPWSGQFFAIVQITPNVVLTALQVQSDLLCFGTAGRGGFMWQTAQL